MTADGLLISQEMNGVHLTFSGNCRQAMNFYQECFGGALQIQEFEGPLFTYSHLPVVSATLRSQYVTLMGSDMVSAEGRQMGNYMAIYLECRNARERSRLLRKLQALPESGAEDRQGDIALLEFTDLFEVRWILALR